MQKLSLIIILFASLTFAQSPHGKNFNIDCQECHNTEDWEINYNKLNFNHAMTGFAIIGQHKLLNCQSCHKTLEFSAAESSCQSCHNDMHQNSVGKSCDNCHNSNTWLVGNIDELHMFSRFPLEGAHKNANCVDCHQNSQNLVFEPLSIDCYDCHVQDYQSTTFPNHVEANFSTDCSECHQITDIGWDKGAVSHEFFPLSGGHKIGNCFDCHSTATFEGLSPECITCHQQDYNSTTDPNHQSSNFSTDCNTCHTLNPGWRPASFKNHDSFFELTGAHKQIENDCAKCHSSGYKNTPNQCYDCHSSNYNNTSNPNHQSAGFGTDCESCHSTKAWEPADFDHDNQFFPIYSGKHKGEWNSCADCHTDGTNYQVFSCLTCHEHSQSKMNDKHKGISGYSYESTSCLACHPNGKEEGAFNHAATGFPLEGAHASNSCGDCHQDGLQLTTNDCSTCHTPEYQSSTNPNHQQLGIPLECEQCHTSNPNWKPATFAIHNDFYLIQGAHTSIANDCATCHNGNYNNTGNQCADCHQNDYNNTSNPNHQATGFGTDCETCHSQNAWEPADFDHDNQFFPINSGKHNNQWNECSDCHTSSTNYEVFSCTTCHEHNKTDTDKDHNGVQGYQYLSEECFSCHPLGDSDGAFNHANSAFPLTGQHATTNCEDCHTSGYSNTSNECASCHQNNFNNSSNPNHVNAGISLQCEDCHNSSAWNPSDFSHSSTGFELTGGHNLTQCSDCHQGSTSNATDDCYTCHKSNYESAPEHLTQSYPKTCEDCHNTNNWDDANFNHNSTSFPLTGAHTSTDCSSCHTSGYTGTSTLCKDCHSSDYNSSNNPNHSSLGLSMNCNNCHTTNPNWEPASFDVHNDYYVLQGAHASIANDCATCHNGNYNNTGNQCFDCHSSDYNGTTNPNHKNSGFGTDCESCHSQNAWKPATFDHDNQYFPIYSGKHKDEWNNCSDCHTNQSDYSQFSCLNCHEHNQTKMNDKHKDVSGYSYQSSACYDCHPNGKESALFKSMMKIMR